MIPGGGGVAGARLGGEAVRGVAAIRITTHEGHAGELGRGGIQMVRAHMPTKLSQGGEGLAAVAGMVACGAGRRRRHAWRQLRW